ncbi:hypothetical protein [Caulobacter sp. NIBR1757]|uniref:hypothetical protein n=1 Tax=Caulobacter sp. NIBR1757 TaxID=3016000 RepID=UPI0022F0A448|nr:hypothetical protein [Caulobacter sp. NIBR1757]WGM38293.1 hypothetical protein AMEJIAPC_01195 [Caulobacter sp. NIBR1757]
MTDQTPGWKVAEDLTVDHFSGVAVSLFDLYRERLRQGQSVVSGITFENCRIEGPAVMLVIGGCHFHGVDFGSAGGDIRTLVLRPASPNGVVGAIPVRDCTFRGGHLFGIGYTGGESFLNQILALGGPTQ